MSSDERMKELVKLLNKYAYQYYVLDEPTGIVLPDSPTRKIGGDPIKEFAPHKHIKKLYSLDKCNSYDELREWSEKIKKVAPDAVYTLEYKLDGLTLCLTYENGYFKGAATRGNGEVGEDVTAQEPLKNARNGVAGAIRNLDPKVTASRNLDIIFYNVNYIEDENIASQRENIDFLKRNSFKTDMLFVTSDIEEIIKKIDSVDRKSLDFLIDGMVIKVDDLALRERLGYTDKFPRWAIAYKFEAEETTTILEDVQWNVGRTGKLTPLAILEPVELCGATIRRATLNNYDDIQRKKVKIGSRVFIRRSNDVIPEILGVSEDNGGKEIPVPTVCPACGSDLVRDGAHIYCPNEGDCPPQIIGRLTHFVEKDCMDIRGVSEKSIEGLHEKLGVRFPTDLYSLTRDDLARLDGFKDKKIDNFLASVEKSKSVPLDRFINALGIENIGKKSARDLAERFGSISELMKADEATLVEVDEIGDIVAESITSYFGKHGWLIEKFKEIGIDPKFNVVKPTGGVLTGKKLVLTGTLPTLTRTEATELIEKAGGTTSSSVSKSTDYVLAGENAGSKLDKARSLGVKIITENELLSMING